MFFTVFKAISGMAIKGQPILTGTHSQRTLRDHSFNDVKARMDCVCKRDFLHKRGCLSREQMTLRQRLSNVYENEYECISVRLMSCL